MATTHIYCDHLYRSLCRQRQNALRQEGKSNIDPADYADIVDAWYGQIFEYMAKNPPVYYVESVEIRQDSCQVIRELHYVYCSQTNYVEDVSISIFWI